MKKLKEIIKMAIQEEEYFMNFYKKSADSTDVPAGKKLLLLLARQEAVHRQKLMDLDLEKVSTTIIRSSLDGIEMKKSLMLTPVNELKNLKDIFTFAIEAEGRAKELYSSLSDATDDFDAKHLFDLLALEERKHETLLKKALEDLGI